METQSCVYMVRAAYGDGWQLDGIAVHTAFFAGKTGVYCRSGTRVGGFAFFFGRHVQLLHFQSHLGRIGG